jgi:hypothetical protein
MSLRLLDLILPNLGVEWWWAGYGTLVVVVTLSPSASSTYIASLYGLNT